MIGIRYGKHREQRKVNGYEARVKCRDTHTALLLTMFGFKFFINTRPELQDSVWMKSMCILWILTIYKYICTYCFYTDIIDYI